MGKTKLSVTPNSIKTVAPVEEKKDPFFVRSIEKFLKNSNSQANLNETKNRFDFPSKSK